MKFRGIIGLKAGTQVPVVDEKTARSTGTDAEAGGDKTNITSAAAEPGSSTPPENGSFNEKNGVLADQPPAPAKELQYGVQLAEATLKVWTRNHLIAAYVM